MAITAFQPNGNTVLISATTTSSASSATQVSTGGQQGMLVSNPSTVPVYVAAAQTSAVQAAVPTTAAPCPGLCLPAGQQRALNTPPGGWLAASTSAGSASIFATPGFYG